MIKNNNFFGFTKIYTNAWNHKKNNNFILFCDLYNLACFYKDIYIYIYHVCFDLGGSQGKASPIITVDGEISKVWSRIVSIRIQKSNSNSPEWFFIGGLLTTLTQYLSSLCNWTTLVHWTTFNKLYELNLIY
jgi:hypothetical protein